MEVVALSFILLGVFVIAGELRDISNAIKDQTKAIRENNKP